MVALSPTVRATDFDLCVSNAQGVPVIVGEIQYRAKDRQREAQKLQERARDAGVPYALFVDLSSAEIFDVAAGPNAPPVLELPTRAFLDAYASGMDEKKVQVQYLQRLVDSWFRNILSPLPGRPVPGIDRLEESGLLSQIEEGTAEVKLGNYF